MTKPWVPIERAYKTILETGVKSDVAFCLGPSIQKTNSVEFVAKNITTRFTSIP